MKKEKLKKYLDPLAPVDEGVAAVGVHPGDSEVGVTLAEHVLLVQVRAGQLKLKKNEIIESTEIVFLYYKR